MSNVKMETKKLSDLPLNEVIYSCVGEHTGDPFIKSLEKKAKDLKNNPYALWAVRLPYEKMKALCRGKKEIYALLINNGKPTIGEDTYSAHSTDDPAITIPDFPKMGLVTCAAGKNYYAFVVAKIIRIVGDKQFLKNKYERVLFCNGQEFLKLRSDPPEQKSSKYLAEYALLLKPPFIVRLEDFRPVSKN